MIKRISEHKSPREDKKKRKRQGGKERRIAAALSVFLFALGLLYTTEENTLTVVAGKRELPIYSVEREDNKISISFDAAWGGDKTRKILDILDEFHVHATFFLVDTWTEKFPELVREIDQRGHEIGNHSTTHPHMTRLSREQMVKELKTMSDHVSAITGKTPVLFRAPYGDYNNQVVKTARQQGYEVIQWSVDSLDWKNQGTENLIRRAVHDIQKGDIVLFHNDSASITQALPEILRIYQEKGLEVVPVSKLLLPAPYVIDVRGRQKNDPTKIPEVAE